MTAPATSTPPGMETAQRLLAEMVRLGFAEGYTAALWARRRAARQAVRALLAGDVTTALDLAHAHELLDATAEAAYAARGDGTRAVTTPRGEAAPGAAAPATRACAHCGAPFEPTSPTQEYCTRSHRNLAYRARKRVREREASPPGLDAGDA